ncbi:Neprilysin-1 [Temnothorax longispinosus]|uniref:Neprilysin-1 n=1 Tax=Temnothorax longispinosus TaxID=300112 RepID=A0A4S2KWF4_9HYME|nr:Neprilysin-1 [Temnothorax longispinosus]
MLEPQANSISVDKEVLTDSYTYIQSACSRDEACVRERDGPEGVCDTDVCVEASKRILTSMKRGVDPCKDFYKFACGGFRDQQPYQPSASFNILQAQIDERIHSERFAQFSRLDSGSALLALFACSILVLHLMSDKGRMMQ